MKLALFLGIFALGAAAAPGHLQKRACGLKCNEAVFGECETVDKFDSACAVARCEAYTSICNGECNCQDVFGNIG